MRNTEITYLYRDVDNYKQGGHVVINGLITFKEIEPYLDEERYFIPSSVGLKNLQEGLMKYSGGMPTESDHAFHELQEGDFTPTDAPATITLTREQLISLFSEASSRHWPTATFASTPSVPIAEIPQTAKTKKVKRLPNRNFR